MGSGFLEPVYQGCLAIELRHQGTPFVAREPICLYYRGERLNKTYEPDFVCHGKVVVEIKAVSALADEHRAQMINYLHASGLTIGLLINFGRHPGLEYERFIQSNRNRGTTLNPPVDVLPCICVHRWSVGRSASAAWRFTGR